MDNRPPPPTRSRQAHHNPTMQLGMQTNPQQLWQLAPIYNDGGYVLQPYDMRRPPAHAPSGQRPNQSSARKNNKRGRQNKRRNSNQHQADTGMPSLSSLRKENRAKARKYFGAGDGCSDLVGQVSPLVHAHTGKQRFNPPASVPRTTPRTVPRAPENTTTYLISGASTAICVPHINTCHHDDRPCT